MTRYWKIVLTLVCVLLIAGIVIGGAGILTDASPDRIAELLYDGWDGVRDALDSLLARLTAVFQSVSAAVRSL
jgi:hypothetical protein